MDTTTTMSPQEQEQWHRIRQYNIPNQSAAEAFKKRLCEEQGWSPEFCEQAILECKKLFFLARATKRMLAPSRVVDAVLDLFVLNTRDLRNFSFEILGCQFDHFPYHGEPTLAEMFERMLMASTTRGLYQEYFGEMPEAFWRN